MKCLTRFAGCIIRRNGKIFRKQNTALYIFENEGETNLTWEEILHSFLVREFEGYQLDLIF